VHDADEIVSRARGLYGSRLHGIFAFGSRIAGNARPDSDLDVAVWLDGPFRRKDSWLPWVREFGERAPTLDPTFITRASLDTPPSWLLEAVRTGVQIWFDPTGELEAIAGALRAAISGGTYQRRLFMGLPYYARAAS
jgi:Polymerase beta, Nucleotidyltransferase